MSKAERVVMSWNRDDLGMSLRHEASAAALSRGVTVLPLDVRAAALGLAVPTNLRGRADEVIE